MLQYAENQIYVLNALNYAPLEGIKNVPITFLSVFPEELLKVPPIRAIGFAHRLEANHLPIEK